MRQNAAYIPETHRVAEGRGKPVRSRSGIVRQRAYGTAEAAASFEHESCRSDDLATEAI